MKIQTYMTYASNQTFIYIALLFFKKVHIGSKKKQAFFFFLKKNLHFTATEKTNKWL